mmetsp:Transcript_53049/g.86816  ORF Transcript_53049/g.86816 Transcript_53049/m.86816 type:complete len:82 (+) Transcript_53049:29-274(+)
MMFLFAKGAPIAGNDAVLVKVVSVQRPSGGATIYGKAVAAVRMEDVWIQAGTGGLYHALCDPQSLAQVESEVERSDECRIS